MDLSIATELAVALAPALPYLVKGTDEAVKEAGKKLGAAAWEQCAKLWALLKPKVEASPSAAKALERLANEPEREALRTSFSVELEDLLKADPGLLAQLTELLKTAGGTQHYQAFNSGDGAIAQGDHAVAAGKGGVAVGGNVYGNVKTGGSIRK